MPNGDPFASPTEWKNIKTFFQGLSPILSTFAATHNLAIDEYYHESPTWTFRFRHPKGGIYVERVDDSTIRVGSSWYIDEFENFTRYLKSDEGSDLIFLILGAIDVRELLEKN